MLKQLAVAAFEAMMAIIGMFFQELLLGDHAKSCALVWIGLFLTFRLSNRLKVQGAAKWTTHVCIQESESMVSNLNTCYCIRLYNICQYLTWNGHRMSDICDICRYPEMSHAFCSGRMVWQAPLGVIGLCTQIPLWELSKKNLECKHQLGFGIPLDTPAMEILKSSSADEKLRSNTAVWPCTYPGSNMIEQYWTSSR